MPRASRIVLSEVPLHVIQRGHDRQRCFLIDDDFEAYRRWLHEQALLVRCEVHAYVLMSNHVHLLVTVPDAAGLAAMVKGVAQQYAQYFNARRVTTGTVWDGRYKLPCAVGAVFPDVPALYRTEPRSGRNGAFSGQLQVVQLQVECRRQARRDYHPALHVRTARRNPSERRQAYLRLFHEALTPLQIDQIRTACNRGVLGG